MYFLTPRAGHGPASPELRRNEVYPHIFCLHFLHYNHRTTTDTSSHRTQTGLQGCLLAMMGGALRARQRVAMQGLPKAAVPFVRSLPPAWLGSDEQARLHMLCMIIDLRLLMDNAYDAVRGVTDRAMTGEWHYSGCPGQSQVHHGGAAPASTRCSSSYHERQRGRPHQRPCSLIILGWYAF
jgi:hypothetical protein